MNNAFLIKTGTKLVQNGFCVNIGQDSNVDF